MNKLIFILALSVTTALAQVGQITSGGATVTFQSGAMNVSTKITPESIAPTNAASGGYVITLDSGTSKWASVTTPISYTNAWIQVSNLVTTNIIAMTNKDLRIMLGDKWGVNKLIIQNSEGEDNAWINSGGGFVFKASGQMYSPLTVTGLLVKTVEGNMVEIISSSDPLINMPQTENEGYTYLAQSAAGRFRRTLDGQYLTNLTVFLKMSVVPPVVSIAGARLWSDGTNLCAVIWDGSGTRTTNKFTMSSWP